MFLFSDLIRETSVEGESFTGFGVRIS